MSDEIPPSLSHFTSLAFTDAFWDLKADEQGRLMTKWVSTLSQGAGRVHLYQVFPAASDADLLVWSAVALNDNRAAAAFFTTFARGLIPWRKYLNPVRVLWGHTGASVYSKAKSSQEIDPFAPERKTYLIAYPFSKNAEWFALHPEARQGMMNEHIRLGKQFSDIKQLLLYSYGLQDQEFVVVYETENLERFSELVRQLRSTDARAYTERDTPVHTAVFRSTEDFLAQWNTS